MAKGRTGPLVLACAISLACHLLAFLALRSERPIVMPPAAAAVEVSLMREPEALRPAPSTTPQVKRVALGPAHAPQAVVTNQVDVSAAPSAIETNAGPTAPIAPASVTPTAPPPTKLVFDCDELTPKAALDHHRCPPKRMARAGSRPGGGELAFARQADFDAEKAQKNGGPIVIGHLTLRPAPDKNSDPNLIGIFKLSF